MYEDRVIVSPKRDDEIEKVAVIEEVTGAPFGMRETLLNQCLVDEL